MTRVGIATAAEVPDLDDEGRLLLAALSERGVAAEPVVSEARRKQADTEARMLAVLDELELTGLVPTIDGISALGAAAILAETGDPTRFRTARALVKHAGLAPREKLSGTFTGRTKLSGQGRPGLRLAAWPIRMSSRPPPISSVEEASEPSRLSASAMASGAVGGLRPCRR